MKTRLPKRATDAQILRYRGYCSSTRDGQKDRYDELLLLRRLARAAAANGGQLDGEDYRGLLRWAEGDEG